MHCPFGVIILAGGQGSRLGFNYPKGCFELDEGDSLFKILIRKITSNNGWVAIMTSHETDAMTRDYLAGRNFFGLKERIGCFVQPSHPVTTRDGQPLYDGMGNLIQAPMGNGCVYQAFTQSPLYHQWDQLGIKIINVLPIDNFLADPQDDELISAVQQGVELAVRGIQKSGEEKMGLIEVDQGRLKVIEYTEQQHAGLGYSGLFAMSWQFLQKASQLNLPLHPALKTMVVIDRGANQRVDIIKYEQFIFDAFTEASTFSVLDSCRKKYFCPLKDKLGPNGIEQVKEKFLEWKLHWSVSSGEGRV